MANTNERVLYKRKCDLTGESILSMFPEDAPFPVYKSEAWYSDDWDPYKYGMEYDFSRPFFEQFQELLKKVPRMALVKQGLSKNSEYTHRVHDMKDSYMVFRTSHAENSLYTYIAKDIVDCADCFAISDCELCYECIDCEKCYKTKFSQESKESRDSMFLYGCRNCSNCVGCVNLVNQEYCIWNIKYTREEYLKELEKLELSNHSGIERMKEEFENFRKKFPQRSTVSLKSNKYSGNWFTNCENVKDSFWCINVKDGKYLFAIFNAEDCMDYFQWGNSAELIYESENVGINVSRIKFSSQCWMGAHDLSYCDSCPGAKNCFGCIGTKQGEYSILNKRYTKEEYENLLPKIIEHMKSMPYVDEKGIVYKYGENFPITLSPFTYNETAAMDFFPLNKDEVEKAGYKWKEKEKKHYETTIKSKDLPETIAEVTDEILNQVVECSEKDKEYSVGAYKIIQNELSFYRRMDLPLPKVCFDVRHTRRLAKRPAPVLYNRNCNKCNIEVETVYDEPRAPIVYCEKCYQQEVY
jgi:hypothetical protein